MRFCCTTRAALATCAAGASPRAPGGSRGAPSSRSTTRARCVRSECPTFRPTSSSSCLGLRVRRRTSCRAGWTRCTRSVLCGRCAERTVSSSRRTRRSARSGPAVACASTQCCVTRCWARWRPRWEGRPPRWRCGGHCSTASPSSLAPPSDATWRRGSTCLASTCRPRRWPRSTASTAPTRAPCTRHPHRRGRVPTTATRAARGPMRVSATLTRATCTRRARLRATRVPRRLNSEGGPDSHRDHAQTLSTHTTWTEPQPARVTSRDHATFVY
mmetsp:Transcript_13625/g.43595  ORF Transcript_13625/g.43595 Transcript_13625/m.43595 type:complete len:272 (-) Transcript_13625:123-938(-)